jgi:acetyltransferase-like isoleucine patch superfamily enzyme
MHVPGISAGEGLEADRGVLLGYVPARESGRDADPGRELLLGARARIRSGSVLYRGARIGARFQTGHNVVIREDCTLGDDVCVWSNSVVDYGCRIGDRVKIHSNCYIAQFTEIGPDAFLAPGVMIANDLYPGQPGSAQAMSGPWIGAGAQIGVNVTILPYVRIGARCLVGAGATVVRDIPDGAVAFGNPATVRGNVGHLAPIQSRISAVPASASRYRFSRHAGDQHHRQRGTSG